MLIGRLVRPGRIARANRLPDHCSPNNVSLLHPVISLRYSNCVHTLTGIGHFIRQIPHAVDPSINSCSCWELRALLLIHSKYDFYKFLRRFTPSKLFLLEIDQILANRELRVPLAFTSLLTIADMYTWNSNSDGIVSVRKFAERNYIQQYNEHGTLLPNESLCRNIDQPIKAIDVQLGKASQGDWPLDAVVAQVELLMNKVILCRSRAVVNNVYDFVRNYQCPDISGPLLCSTWVSFYSSPYQSDWKLADELLEANEEKMLPHLDIALSVLADHLLSDRQLNRYCVLLQLFSKSSHKKKTKSLIELLFRHFYVTNNFHGCRSCIQLSRDLKINISAEIIYQFETMQKTKLPPRTSVDLLYRF